MGTVRVKRARNGQADTADGEDKVGPCSVEQVIDLPLGCKCDRRLRTMDPLYPRSWLFELWNGETDQWRDRSVVRDRDRDEERISLKHCTTPRKVLVCLPSSTLSSTFTSPTSRKTISLSTKRQLFLSISNSFFICAMTLHHMVSP